MGCSLQQVDFEQGCKSSIQHNLRAWTDRQAGKNQEIARSKLSPKQTEQTDLGQRRRVGQGHTKAVSLIGPYYLGLYMQGAVLACYDAGAAQQGSYIVGY